MTLYCFQSETVKDDAMTVDELEASARNDDAPGDELSPECQALWHTKAGNWEEAHNIAQDIDTSLGSWIHALLHLIEGDLGNAGYWYSRAGKSPRKPSEIDAHWKEISEVAITETM